MCSHTSSFYSLIHSLTCLFNKPLFITYVPSSVLVTGSNGEHDPGTANLWWKLTVEWVIMIEFGLKEGNVGSVWRAWSRQWNESVWVDARKLLARVKGSSPWRNCSLQRKCPQIREHAAPLRNWKESSSCFHPKPTPSFGRWPRQRHEGKTCPVLRVWMTRRLGSGTKIWSLNSLGEPEFFCVYDF